MSGRSVTLEHPDLVGRSGGETRRRSGSEDEDSSDGSGVGVVLRVSWREKEF